MADPGKTTTTEEQEFEAYRQASLRAFTVLLHDGAREQVFAHFHDSGDNRAGHLNFVIVDPTGRNVIHRGFNGRQWVSFEETTAFDKATDLARIALSEIRDQRRNVEQIVGDEHAGEERRGRKSRTH